MNHELDLKRLTATQLYQPARVDPDPAFTTGSWAAPIDRLLAAGYSFQGCRYNDRGHLFRGMESGLSEALANGRFSHFHGHHEMAAVEQAMGILFLTHEVSDAVTAAGLRQSHPDSALIVLRSELFNHELDARRAAVLAIGDGGIVFRYPFLTRSLADADIAHILVPGATFGALAPLPARWRQRLSRTDAVTADDISAQLIRLGYTAARPLDDPRSRPRA